MRLHVPYDHTCGACGHRYAVEYLENLPATRVPELRQQILDGKFQRFPCPKCQAENPIERVSTTYTDFKRGHYVGVEARSAARRWRDLARSHAAAYQTAIALGPPVAQELGDRMLRRLVLGVHALREKLMLWEAELDDRVVEAVKGDVLAARGLGPDAEMLRLSTVLKGGHLMFVRLAPLALSPGPAPDPLKPPHFDLLGHETVPAASYRQRLARRDAIAADYPHLAEEWMVDVHVTAPAFENEGAIGSSKGN